jgi:hypothetical protein
VADGWCWFVLREEYCWLVADGWFVVREKYCWLVADKPSEQGEGQYLPRIQESISHTIPATNRRIQGGWRPAAALRTGARSGWERREGGGRRKEAARAL